MFDRQLDVALQHLSVDAMLRTAADEERSERPNQDVERPDARPLPDREAERDVLGREERDQHVVHVAAVIDDEHDARVGGEVANQPFVDVTDADAEQDGGKPPRGPVSDAVETGVVVWNDFVRVGADTSHDRVERTPRGVGLVDRRGTHLRIVDQALDDAWTLLGTERCQARGITHRQQRRTGRSGAPPSLYSLRRSELRLAS